MVTHKVRKFRGETHVPLQPSSLDENGHLDDLFDNFSRLEGLAAALASKAPIDSIARVLALRVLSRFDVHGTALVALDAQGNYRTLSTFGYSAEEVTSLNNRGINSRTPLATALREGRTIWFDSQDESAWREFPDMRAMNVPVDPDVRSTIAMPIGHDVPVAGLLITLREQLGDRPVEVQQRFFETLAAILSIVVDGARVRSELVARGSRPPMPKEGELTERQLAILRLIAEGKTNKAIGSRLGYSESTVRHETMRIFRLLGVASRSQAVTAGASRGLLPIQREAMD